MATSTVPPVYVVTLEVTDIVSACKDVLTAEWVVFKKTNQLKARRVCTYSMGGPRDNPVATLDSVAYSSTQWDLLLKDVVDFKVASHRPVLENEMMVGADCSVSIYPARHKVAEENYTSAYTVGTLPPPPKGKRSKKQAKKSPEEQFLSMVEQVANYVLDHVKKISQLAVPSGNMKAQYLLIGSASLTRNRLNYFKDLLRLPSSKSLGEIVSRATELINVLSQTALNYHCELMRSSLMHDTDSHDWTSEKRYQEGECISRALHMWIFYLQGVRNDLYRFTSPTIAETILSSVVNDTLNILVTRYMQAEPSEFRLPQYRGDVVTILAFLATLAPSLVRCPSELFTGRLHHSVLLPLHRRAQLLLAVAALKAAPVEALAANKKLLQTGQLRPGPTSPSSLQITSTPAWLSFVNPALYPPGTRTVAELPPHVAAYHMMHCVACNGAPNWTLLVRSLVQNELFGARALLCALRDFWSGARPSKACGGALCTPHLCSPPLTPQTVYAAVVQIVYRCVGGVRLLNQIMFPNDAKPACWDSLDQTQVWNTQRPPWHHVTVQLAVPALLPVVQQVVRSLPPEAPAQPAHPSQVSVRLEHHLVGWTLQLLKGVEAYADDLPPALVHLCQKLNASAPSSVKPAGGHVVCQVVVSALYSIVSSRSSVDQLCESSKGVTEGQWNMLLAIAERLCSLHHDCFAVHVQTMTRAILARLPESTEGGEGGSALPNPLSEYVSEQSVRSVCESLAAQVLVSVQGQHALGAVWEFLQHNMEWVQHVLGVSPLLPLHPNLTAPDPQLVFAPQPLIYNPLYYHARMFYTRFEEMGILNHGSNWESALNCAESWLPPRTALSLVRGRPELKEDAQLSSEQRIAVSALTPLLDTLHEE